MKSSTNSYLFALDRPTERKLAEVRKEIQGAVRKADQNLERIRRVPPLTGRIERDRRTLGKLHGLALQEARIEEKALVAALAGVRIKQGLLLRQQKNGGKKVPDFRAESIFLQMKEDRLQETLRSINQELEEWIKKLRAAF